VWEEKLYFYCRCIRKLAFSLFKKQEKSSTIPPLPPPALMNGVGVGLFTRMKKEKEMRERNLKEFIL